MEESLRRNILIIDDDDEIRYSLNRVLSSRGYAVKEASSGEAGIESARAGTPEVIFLDNRMEGMSGLETLQHLRSVAPAAMVILMTAFGTTQTAIEAMKFGAFDYIIKPFDLKKVLELTEKALQSHHDLEASRGRARPVLNSEDYKEGIVGSSEAMQTVFKAIGQVATSDVTVMVTGESGTGKELVARCIHQHSLRGTQPFMAVNCAAIPDNLIESELFGHEKGSFTGATQQRLGKFELCDKGTLFLDEIGDMALPTQTKILRALQEGEIQRVGSEKTVKVDVRLIAATNRDLEKMVRDKTFREDLYYRLNVMRIRIPSLRDRLSDVPALVDFMLQRLQATRRTRVTRVSAEALAMLCRYEWPGNVRELENTIQRCVVVAQGDTILKKDLPQEILDAVPQEASPETEPAGTAGRESPAGESGVPDLDEAIVGGTVPPERLGMPELWDLLYERLREGCDRNLLQEIEKEITQRVLVETGGNQVKASALLGITRATLRKRIESYGLSGF
ncbi:MAG: sigma-54 dependent transcriptional regulator [Oceanipulchritudo sp.]